MSLKPAKKSDQGKQWMSKRRNRPRKMSPEYHLIVTEGTKTEPLYFTALKDLINRHYSERISLKVEGRGVNTLTLFDEAKQLVEHSLIPYKHVWVVYDTDDFPPEQINQTAELCRRNSSESTQYHATWSNQCIELWYLLHFSYFQSDILRSEYAQKLTDCLNALHKGCYAKNREDMFEILLPYLPTAIENARKLWQRNSGKPPASSAPGTAVHELLDKLSPYLVAP